MGKHRKRDSGLYVVPNGSRRSRRKLAVLSAAGLVAPLLGGAAVYAATSNATSSCGAAACPAGGVAEQRGPVPAHRKPPPGAPGAAKGSVRAATATAAPAAPRRAVAFIPYADLLTWPPFDLVKTSRQQQIRRFGLGFVTAGTGCTAVWGGSTVLSDRVIHRQLTDLRGHDGSIVLSLTGPAGTDLARQCESVDALVAQYRAMLDDVGAVSGVDLFLPDDELAGGVVADRRAAALARLQRERKLDVSVTVPVGPDGLSAGALGMLRSARAHGLDVAVLNLFGGRLPDLPGEEGGGRALIRAATAAHGQLAQIYPGDSASARWARIGVTPVIGVYDAGTFGLDDARRVRDWAQAQRIGRLSMWSLARDDACGSGDDRAADECSGVDQRPGRFMEILRGAD